MKGEAQCVVKWYLNRPPAILQRKPVIAVHAKCCGKYIAAG
jgi:hypothetical protein